MAHHKVHQRELIGRQRRWQEPARLEALDPGLVELEERVLAFDAENVAVVGYRVGQDEGMV
jgi:hypothetical protein